MTTYKDSGVSIEKGDEASAILFNASKRTWQNRTGRAGEVLLSFDDFSGLRTAKLPTDEGTVFCIGFDTVGTKSEIAERTGDFTTLGHDLIAMVADDAVVRGGEPAIVGSNLEVNSLTQDPQAIQYIEQLAQGYVSGANRARVAVLNGELAEIGARVSGYGAFNLNWGASCVWFARKERLLSGKRLSEGDHLVAFRENGFRCNGISLVRRIFSESYGDQWHEVERGGMPLGKQVLTPSVIYSALAVDLFGGVSQTPRAAVHGIAHITGGGVPEKLGRMLKPARLGAKLTGLFPPCPAMIHAQEKGNVSDREAYRAWNMGSGMLVATPDPQTVIKVAGEHGVEAMTVGRITREPGIRLVSRGVESPGTVLDF